MAITRFGKPLSLAWSATSGSASSPLNTSLIEATFEQTTEQVEFFDHTYRVAARYEGKLDATLTVTTADMGAAALFDTDDTFTSLVLTVQGSKQAGGTAADSATITFSSAILESKSGITFTNEDSAPRTQTLTFRLNRAEGASDPTVAVAVVA